MFEGFSICDTMNATFRTDDARCIAFKLPRRVFFDKQTRIVAKVIDKKKRIKMHGTTAVKSTMTHSNIHFRKVRVER